MLAAQANAPALDFDQLSAPACRAMAEAGGAFAPGDPVAAEEDWRIPASGGELRVPALSGHGPEVTAFIPLGDADLEGGGPSRHDHRIVDRSSGRRAALIEA